MSILDLTPDALLGTTRAVRKRLDLTRPVETEVLQECVALAMQAPLPPYTNIHFVVVTDPSLRVALASCYRKGVEHIYANKDQLLAAVTDERATTLMKVVDSSLYLADHLHEVPVHIIPCVEGRVTNTPQALQSSLWSSIYPATWSLMLAARSRGLGTVLTVNHLFFEQEAAEILGLPYEEVTQAALIPVAYTLGTSFRSAVRPPLASVLHWDRW